MALLTQSCKFLNSQKLLSLSRRYLKMSSRTGLEVPVRSRMFTEIVPQECDFSRYNNGSISYRGFSYIADRIIRRNIARQINLPFLYNSGARRLVKDRHKDYHENSDQSGSSHPRHFYWPLLGAAFFSKGSSDEISDSEKKRLSEKIKKMTPIERIIARGVLCMSDQDFDKASELFHEALNMARADKDSAQELLILNLLATNYFECGDLESAKKLFVSIIQLLLLEGTSSTDSAILEISLKLASIYSTDFDTHDRAMTGYKFVIDSLLDKLKDLFDESGQLKRTEFSEQVKNDIALLGWSYDWFAKHLIEINHFDKAIELLKRALNISSVVLGPTHDQTLILYNDIGTAMAMNNLPKEGKSYILNAVEGAIKSQSKELASFYVNLALVNLKLQQTDDAKRYCEYSMELASKNREQHNSSDVIKLSQHCLDEVKRLTSVYNK